MRMALLYLEPTNKPIYINTAFIASAYTNKVTGETHIETVGDGNELTSYAVRGSLEDVAAEINMAMAGTLC